MNKHPMIAPASSTGPEQLALYLIETVRVLVVKHEPRTRWTVAEIEAAASEVNEGFAWPVRVMILTSQSDSMNWACETLKGKP